MESGVKVSDLAVLALETGPDLSTHTSSITFLQCSDLRPNLDDLTNDFVTDTDWCGSITPPSSDGVNIRTADTAALDLDVDIVVAKLLWFEFLLLELLVLSQLIYHKPLELVWVRHDCDLLWIALMSRKKSSRFSYQVVLIA